MVPDGNAHGLPAWMRRRVICWRQSTITLVVLARRCTGECQHDTRRGAGPSRLGQDLSSGWRQLIAGLGAVRLCLVWDGEGAIGRRRPGLTAGC